MTEKDRFPFPDQVEDRFHGNDRGMDSRMRGNDKRNRGGFEIIF